MIGQRIGNLQIIELIGEGGMGTVYRAKDIDPVTWEPDDGRVFMWPTHDWFSTDKPIAGIDPKTRTISLEGTGGYDIRANNRYFVQNILALLDVPGECQIGAKSKTLYCIPRADATAIEAATAESLIAVRGQGNLVILTEDLEQKLAYNLLVVYDQD